MSRNLSSLFIEAAQVSIWRDYVALMRAGADEGGVLYALADEIRQVESFGPPFRAGFAYILDRLASPGPTVQPDYERIEPCEPRT